MTPSKLASCVLACIVSSISVFAACSSSESNDARSGDGPSAQNPSNDASSEGGSSSGNNGSGNGACGAANGLPASAAPKGADLCASGTPSEVEGVGPWTWTCAGSGASASCNAPLSLDGPELPGPNAIIHQKHPYYTCTENRYVATAANGGDDSNDGLAPTAGNGHGPWRTFQHANDSIPEPAPGYCINVGDGTYTLSSIIRVDRGGNQASMTGFVVWRSMNLLGAKLVTTNSAPSAMNVSAPYVVVDGFELDGKHFTNGDAGINTCFNGTTFNGIHHILSLNNYIHHFGGNGIANCWAEYYWVIHNRLDQNAYNSWNSGASTYEPMAIPNYTPTAYDNLWTPYHNVYAYNRCYGNFTRPEGGPHTDGNGIIYDDTQHEQNAPNVPYASKALIMGNVAWGNGGFGIQVGPTSANADVFNNTAYNNGLDTVNTGTWRGEISSAFAHGNTFKNNIGYAIKGSGILTNNAPFRGNNPTAPTNSWSNNVAFGAKPDMNAPDSFPTPANKVDTNPNLVDVASANFALKGDSPAIGFGAVVPYWQQQKAGEIDVGACPHEATSCP